MGGNDKNNIGNTGDNVPKNGGADDINKKKDDVAANASDEIKKNNLRTFAEVTIGLFSEAVKVPCDIVEDTSEHGGNIVYNINKKGVPFEKPAGGLPLSCADGQIKLTIMKNGTINLRLTVYGENPDYIYYHTEEGLTTQNFMAEIPHLNSFLTRGEVSDTSMLKKDSLRGKYEEPGDLEAMIASAEAKKNKK